MRPASSSHHKCPVKISINTLGDESHISANDDNKCQITLYSCSSFILKPFCAANHCPTRQSTRSLRSGWFFRYPTTIDVGLASLPYHVSLCWIAVSKDKRHDDKYWARIKSGVLDAFSRLCLLIIPSSSFLNSSITKPPFCDNKSDNNSLKPIAATRLRLTSALSVNQHDHTFPREYQV